MQLGILTIQSPNCGNRLQNYALQETLRNLGHSVQSIRRIPTSRKSIIRYCVRDIIKNDMYAKIRSFDKKYIEYSDSIVAPDFISPRICEAFDKFVIGSDQVWNPTFRMNGRFDYLPDVPRNRKLAYAASFGVKSLGEKQHDIACLLQDFDWISVREIAGADIVEQLTGHRPPVVLDPTMLIDTCEWNKLARKPRHVECNEPYLLRYFLGSSTDNDLVNKIVAQTGLHVLDLFSIADKVGPCEFVWLVSHASFVCADSFHGSVFSLLYHKPLAIIRRSDSTQDMFSRLDTLTRLFGVSNCLADQDRFNINSNMIVNWEQFDIKLDEIRNHSINWLQHALDAE